MESFQSMEDLDETSIYGVKVFQRKDGWRFSLDSIILSKFFVEIELSYFKNERMDIALDVGTGCGIIPILIQRFLKERDVRPPKFIGLDLDLRAVGIASMNFLRNELTHSWAVGGDIRFYPFKKNLFDIIVSNPPYIPVGEGKISPRYDIAKWEISFDLRSFARSSSELLTDRGRIYVVYTSSRLGELLSVFFRYNLNSAFIRFFHHSRQSGSDFFVLSAQKNGRRKLTVLPPIFGGSDEDMSQPAFQK